MATLFSYFTKSPKVAATPGNKTNTSPKEQAKGCKNGSSNTPSRSKAPEIEFQTHDIGDLIWAKMDGHPWWPSMICKHPSSERYQRKVGKFVEIHVQFFGHPPTRGWVRKRDIQGLKNRSPDGTKDVKEAYEEAMKALKLKKEERIEKLYACIHSDEEMSEEEAGQESEEEMEEDHKNGVKENGINDDEDEPIVTNGNRKRTRRSTAATQRKRAKTVIESDSESEDEYKPDGEQSADDDDGESGVDENELSDIEISDGDEEEVEKPSKKKAKTVNNFLTPTRVNKNEKTPPKASTFLSPKLSDSVNRAKNSLAKFSAEPSSPAPSFGVAEERTFFHETLQFLKDGHRKDKYGRLHTDPDYDPRTLLVPETFLRSKDVTPASKQWWKIKRDNFDTILFFKMGKFYELYHIDAVIGVKELGILFMKGKAAHCGFPEIAFSRYADILVQKGYKVARIEQTETPQMMSERCSKKPGSDKVVTRELVGVTTKGTKTFGYMEGQSTDSESAFLMAFCEKSSGDGAESSFGVCFLDTSIGKFHIGQFKDDRQCSRFRTLISHYPPVQILFERNCQSHKSQNILNHELVSTIKESLAPGVEFWDSGKTLKFLIESNGFEDSLSKSTDETATKKWPDVLKKMISKADTLGLTASDEYQLAVSALGACIWYLKRCCIEEELLSMCQFEEYVPVDCISRPRAHIGFPEKRQRLILDGVSLINLDIVKNDDGGLEGTLLEQLDHCCTPFGKRQLKQWICAPLCHPDAINSRLDAVEELMELSGIVKQARDIMRSMPDMERLLRRIHAIGSVKKGKNHPESRQILFNNDVYNKRKIGDLLSALDCLEKANKAVSLFREESEEIRSTILKKVLEKPKANTQGGFPDLREFLSFFKNAFDHSKARKDGVILPKKGVHDEYDTALDDMDRIKGELDDYLEKQKKRIGCRAITYFGNGKFRYQMEIPEKNLDRNTPNEYHLKSQRKGFKRFRTDYIEEKLLELGNAEDRRDAALKDTMRNIFHKFDEKYRLLEGVLQCISTLDCLMSLAMYSSNADGVLCRPDIIMPSEGILPLIDIRNSRHPCVNRTFTGDDFIPNDIHIGNVSAEDSEGTSERNCLLVTGPNMGGKSTLMRQTGIIIIMAQMGCYVPAEVCRFTPVDRVFTRLGAHDRILHGESTFFVELSETATILQHATRNSLVLLDELGRGTATYDGTAIATAVVRELAHSIKCITLFSTHYHSLVDEFSTDPTVQLGHMACMVENEDEGNEGDPSNETITFLYKLTAGPCPKSYGFNAAKLAGLPSSIIKNAYLKARALEDATTKCRLFKSIFNGTSIDKSFVGNLNKQLSKVTAF